MAAERIVILGASRGLGAELCRQIPAAMAVLAISRKPAVSLPDNVRFYAADLSGDLADVAGEIEAFSPHRIFYIAGGGPFGSFADKAWKDHVWAWNVTFLAAARLAHAALNFASPPRQIVLCGSAIAERAGDPGAVSYASAKHALRGFYDSLRLERPDFDLRLFSPGYLDTELLPKNAQVRYKGVWQPEQVAKELWTWSCSNEVGGHRSYSSHP